MDEPKQKKAVYVPQKFAEEQAEKARLRGYLKGLAEGGLGAAMLTAAAFLAFNM